MRRQQAPACSRTVRFDQYKEQALARIAKLERENVRASRGGRDDYTQMKIINYFM